jgi:hypothetical protein
VYPFRLRFFLTSRILTFRTRSPTQHDMYFHLKSLSTFEPHPRAPADPLKWPQELPRRSVQLGFQICDDGLFVLRHNQRIGSTDRLCGWQWTTGRLAVVSLRLLCCVAQKGGGGGHELMETDTAGSAGHLIRIFRHAHPHVFHCSYCTHAARHRFGPEWYPK